MNFYVGQAGLEPAVFHSIGFTDRWAHQLLNWPKLFGGCGRIRTSIVYPEGTVLQTVGAPPSLLHTQIILFQTSFCRSGGIRTHLLTILTPIYKRPILRTGGVTLPYISNIFLVVPVGLEPTITQLKRLVLYHSATRPSLCSHPDSNRNP